jgi:fatty acid CoA ligase FadD9
VLTGYTPTRLVVFDYHPEVDDERETFETAKSRLASAGCILIVESLADVLARGRRLPVSRPIIPNEQNPLRLLMYTSGSTGVPKGAMYNERLVANFWRRSNASLGPAGAPSITLCCMPMSHALGQYILYGTLGSGGTAYFAAKSDLSTLVEDLALVRPTNLKFVPHVWEMLFDAYESELDRRAMDDRDRATRVKNIMTKLRQNVVGGRYLSAATSSAPISAELKAWVESFLNMHVVESYGSTEDGAVLVDGQVRRPQVTDYKLADVPDLGYFRTDQPHPRGELLVRSEELFAGYYNRPDVTAEVFDPDGYYRTGDIVAEVGPDRLAYLDRRNDVLRLSHGDFVAVSNLEAVFRDSPLVRQIYLYGNSARAYLLAVVVPTTEVLGRHEAEELRRVIDASLQDMAENAGLAPYEMQRDFIVETTPFTAENGLLTGIGKLARLKLRDRYGDRLEHLYTDRAEAEGSALRELRPNGANQSAPQERLPQISSS